MRSYHLTNGPLLSGLVLLLFTSQTWASPLSTPSSSNTLSSHLPNRNDILAVPAGFELMSKRETALSLNAGGGWTMNFVPYGIFLPINSGALILKELYQQSIAYAVKAEMSGLPTEQTVKIFLGALEFEFVSPTSSVPWEFIHNFSKQMLLTTAMGFTGQFVTEFVHEHGNKVIVAMRIVTKSMSVLRGSGMVT